MINFVYISGEGLIDTFDKTTNSYKTTKKLNEAYFDESEERVKSVAEFFGGVVLTLNEENS